MTTFMSNIDNVKLKFEKALRVYNQNTKWVYNEKELLVVFRYTYLFLVKKMETCIAKLMENLPLTQF